MSTSFDAQLVQLAERLSRRWYFTRLRARTPDGKRQDVKDARTMRGVRLMCHWNRKRRSS